MSGSKFIIKEFTQQSERLYQKKYFEFPGSKKIITLITAIMNNYFITGIGTGVGKTFVAAILTEALQADYWKPVQCGTAGGTDTERVSGLISNTKTVLHKESYCFKEPVSPHLAAELEYEKIKMQIISLPQTNNHLIIEGAGGLMVPLNEHNFVIDLAKQFESEIIFVG